MLPSFTSSNKVHDWMCCFRTDYSVILSLSLSTRGRGKRGRKYNLTESNWMSPSEIKSICCQEQNPVSVYHVMFGGSKVRGVWRKCLPIVERVKERERESRSYVLRGLTSRSPLKSGKFQVETPLEAPSWSQTTSLKIPNTFIFSTHFLLSPFYLAQLVSFVSRLWCNIHLIERTQEWNFFLANFGE